MSANSKKRRIKLQSCQEVDIFVEPISSEVHATKHQKHRYSEALQKSFMDERKARRKRVNEIDQELLKKGIPKKEVRALLKEKDREVQILNNGKFY